MDVETADVEVDEIVAAEKPIHDDSNPVSIEWYDWSKK